MLDRIDAVVFHPIRQASYFFRRSHYIKFVPGLGVQPLAGSKIRRIGVDGWRTLPEEFRSDLDAALYYDSNGHFYFFKGNRYVKYKPGEGAVPTFTGSLIRTIGVTGWTSFPSEFRSDLDAATYYPPNGHAYFFKGNKYIKYRPGVGVVPVNGELIRTIGATGWQDLPESFKQGLDATFYYPIRERLYFFRNRRYARWKPGQGVDPRYPRRLGLPHRKHGGWPGLSTVYGGPLAGCITPDSALLWLWLTGGKTTKDIKIRVNDTILPTPQFLPPEIGTAVTDLFEGIDAVDMGSIITQVLIPGLASNASHTVDICRADDESVIESIQFKTPPRDNQPARIRIGLGSCANSTTHASVNTHQALGKKGIDLLILCGDNCYYYDHDEESTNVGIPFFPHDWTSVAKMLRRQLHARNHPQFVPVCRQTAVFSTWDDHDFGFNNCEGDRDGASTFWVGRNRSAGVYRAMWNHPYRSEGNAIDYDFRWGPLHFFMTDGRFHSHREKWILGDAQLDRLIRGLRDSDAPVKIIVLGSQLVGWSKASFLNSAKNERERLLTAIANDVRGRVLVFSGDVHYSECQPFPRLSPTPVLVEVTSSPLSVGDAGHPVNPLDSNRLWVTLKESFAVIDVDVTGTSSPSGVTGSVRIEAFDESGEVLKNILPLADGDCRTVWNLTTGELS